MNTSLYPNDPARSEVDAAADRQRALERFVQQNVHCCLSSVVSTLATAHGCVDAVQTPASQFQGFVDNHAKQIAELCEQASDLAAPIPDYESAAREAGFYPIEDRGDGNPVWRRDDPDGIEMPEEGTDPEDVCNSFDIDPADNDLFHEPFEFWAVSAYLALELEKHGEKVDRDFEGLCVWARTTTGQAISMDGVVQRIYAELMSA